MADHYYEENQANWSNNKKEKSMEIKIGDVVRLKGGGPKMTVTKQCEDDFVCGWFNSNEQWGFYYSEICVGSDALIKMEE